MKILFVVISVFLAGCAAQKTPQDVMKAGLLDGAIEASKAPLFKMTCSPSCTFASLEVGNPNGGAQLAEVVRTVMAPAPSEVSQNFRAALAFLSPIASGAIVGHFGSKVVGSIVDGFKGGYSSNERIASFIPQPGANTSTVTNTTLSGQGVIGSGTLNAPITTTTTTTTDRHDVINTNPTPRVCTPQYSATGVPIGFSCT